MSKKDQKGPQGYAVGDDFRRRDDAEEQPESGYRDGRLDTKPSAEPEKDDQTHKGQAGSESEFDSEKPPS